MKRKKPRDHVPLVLPEVARSPVEVTERETKHSPAGICELTAIGKRHEGLDGKRYIASFAVHIYVLPEQGGKQNFITLCQTSDVVKLPEAIAVHGVKELGRALMKRYGKKPPRKLNDVAEGETQSV